jgi:hypothetical protein
MIVKDCQFDPVRDLAPVEQFGFIELKDALANSIVPSQMPESDSDYNGIDEPDKVLGRPSDIFEAMDAQKVAERLAASEDREDA